MKTNRLDSIEMSLSAVMRIAKRPGYWEELQKRAGIVIDRPAAAILIILSKRPANFQSVVNRLGIEAPSVSRKVHELEAKGLILRRPTADKRVHELELSRDGLIMAGKLLNAKRSIYQDVLGDWGSQDIEELNRLLNNLANDMKNKFENKGLTN